MATDITTDPDVLNGMACIRNTRIPVANVAASVAAGIPVEEILGGYPDLTLDDIEAAVLYAKQHPAPRRHQASAVWPDAQLRYERAVPRRPRTSL